MFISTHRSNLIGLCVYNDKLSKFSVLHKSSNWPDIVLDVNYAIAVYNCTNLVVSRTYHTHTHTHSRTYAFALRCTRCVNIYMKITRARGIFHVCIWYAV